MLKQLFESLTHGRIDRLVTLAPIGLVVVVAIAIAFDFARTRGTWFGSTLALGGMIGGACSGVWIADVARNPGAGWGLAFLGQVFGLTLGVLLALAVYPVRRSDDVDAATVSARSLNGARSSR